MRALRPLVLLTITAVVSTSCVFTGLATINSSGGVAPSFESYEHISENGRYVVFSSREPLDPGDTNNKYDVFVRDMAAGTTERVSVSSGGAQGNDDSRGAAISADGRYVVFGSKARNLAGFETGSSTDIFVRDRTAGTTIRLTTSTLSSFTPVISADGSAVAFVSLDNNLIPGPASSGAEVYRYDMASGVITRMSQTPAGVMANADAREPEISADGSMVAFSSSATNLVTGDTNSASDVFVNDGGTLSIVSLNPAGDEANGPSGDPRFAGNSAVLYTSSATDIVSGDTNGRADAFLHQLGGSTERVSVADDGSELALGGSGRGVSDDGSRAAFETGDFGSTTLQVRDLDAATTSNIGGLDNSLYASSGALSGDGRYAAFQSFDPLTSTDTDTDLDVYVRRVIDPVPTSMSPSTVARGTTASVAISGTGFSEVTSVFTVFANTPADDIYWSNVVVVDDTTITADVTVAPTADVGAELVFVQSPDGGPGFLSGAVGWCGCLTVTP